MSFSCPKLYIPDDVGPFRTPKADFRTQMCDMEGQVCFKNFFYAHNFAHSEFEYDGKDCEICSSYRQCNKTSFGISHTKMAIEDDWCGEYQSTVEMVNPLP